MSTFIMDHRGLRDVSDTPVPEIGTPIQSTGAYGGHAKQGWVVQDNSSKYGKSVTVVYEDLDIQSVTIPINDLAFEYKGERMTKEKLERIIKQANDKRKKEDDERQSAREKAEKEFQDAASKGREIVERSGTKLSQDLHVLVLEFVEDESDSQTDYFGGKTTESHYIGLMSIKRVSFPRWIKTAKAWLNTDGPKAAGLDDDAIKYIRGMLSDPKEHRENYSMGGGYYITPQRGSRYSTGWKLSNAKTGQELGDKVYADIGRGILTVPRFSSTRREPEPVEEVKSRDSALNAQIMPGRRDGYIEIHFDGKPDEEMRNILKQRDGMSFRFARKPARWYGKSENFELYQDSLEKLGVKFDLSAFDATEQNPQSEPEDLEPVEPIPPKYDFKNLAPDDAQFVTDGRLVVMKAALNSAGMRTLLEQPDPDKRLPLERTQALEQRIIKAATDLATRGQAIVTETKSEGGVVTYQSTIGDEYLTSLGCVEFLQSLVGYFELVTVTGSKQMYVMKNGIFAGIMSSQHKAGKIIKGEFSKQNPKTEVDPIKQMKSLFE